MGFLPLVAQEVGRDACENNAAADQTLERSRPKGHDDHEDAAQDETHGDEQRKLQKQSGGRKVTFIHQKGQRLVSTFSTMISS